MSAEITEQLNSRGSETRLRHSNKSLFRTESFLGELDVARLLFLILDMENIKQFYLQIFKSINTVGPLQILHKLDTRQ